MLPTIATGNVASALGGGYDVANSCRFNDGDSSYLSQSTSSSTGKIFTFSFWMKKSTDGSNNGIFVMSSDSLTHNYIEVATKSAAGLDVQLKNGSGGTFLRRKTTRVFRDFSAWMHICIRFDSTAAEANRLRIYVNGTQETAIDVDGTPAVPEDYVTDFNNTSTIDIARNIAGSHYYDGYLAEMVLVDGSSLAPTSFGEFDEDSPTIFKPIDVSGLTFGTNGFYLDFEDSGDLGDDESGQGNDFTEANLAAADQATDTPTNNFATMNPLANKVTSVTFSEGNLKTDFASGRGGSSSTFGLTTGKWYVEKNITTMPQDERFHLGVVPFEIQDADDMINTNNQGIGISGFNAVIYADSGSGSVVLDNFFGNNTTRFDSWTGIIGMALDITNGTIAFSKDGAWVTGSGTTDTDFSNASKINISTPLARHDVWHVACGTGNSTGTSGVFSMNFGSPPYAISSGNADGNGYGNMEYAIPSGYYTLCTKNLAEYG